MNASTTSRQPAKARPFPAHYQAHGRLYRAIVSLPDSMCDRDRPLQERWVFFDCPSDAFPSEWLEALLTLAWNISTTGWCDQGLIYNVQAAPDVIAQGDANDDTALFECGWGGSEGVEYIQPADVDFFCTPRVRVRLEAALARVSGGGVA